MIKFIAFVAEPNLERKLELLLDAARVAGVPMELGVVSVEAPTKRRGSKRRARSTKKARRIQGKSQFRLGAIPAASSPKEQEVHGALGKGLGGRAFSRREASDLLVARGIVKHPSGYLTKFARNGGMIAE